MPDSRLVLAVSGLFSVGALLTHVGHRLRRPSAERTVSRDCSGDKLDFPAANSLPLILSVGGLPAVMNRSEAPFSTTSFNNLSNSILPSKPT